MYVVAPGAIVQALDAATGDLLWEYKRKVPANVAGQARTKVARDLSGHHSLHRARQLVVGLDARTGEQRWETKTDARGNTSGRIVVEGKVITGGACAGKRENCYISAHDALTGKEAWRFYTTPAPGEPGDESWGGADLDKRLASTWGLPGTYDPVRKMIYWGIANPMPDQRALRHNGNPDAHFAHRARRSLQQFHRRDRSRHRQARLVLPASARRRLGLRLHPRTNAAADAQLNPDPKFVKWINPAITRGEERDVAVTIGEAGGIFALDRATGQFLWATPFPLRRLRTSSSPDIDVKTGKTTINWDIVFKQPGEQHVICYWNTRSYWPTAYSPATNSLYTFLHR